MTRFDPVADAIRRRAEVGACPFCGTKLTTLKKAGKEHLICTNSDCVHHDTGTKYRLRPGRRRMVAAPPALSDKAAARAKRREELGLGRFDPLP